MTLATTQAPEAEKREILRELIAEKAKRSRQAATFYYWMAFLLYIAAIITGVYAGPKVYGATNSKDY